VSAAEASDAITTFHTAYGFPALGWRALRNQWRQSAALLLMSHPRATTERVARALGYSSPTALCRALANASLPTPGSVRRALDACACPLDSNAA
jgi:AraC-like DNA-binding protein